MDLEEKPRQGPIEVREWTVFDRLSQVRASLGLGRFRSIDRDGLPVVEQASHDRHQHR